MNRLLKRLPSTVMLKHGSHPKPEHGLCLMEAVSYVSGEPHSDMPGCACPVLGEYARAVNDCPQWKNDAERTYLLLPIVPKLVGSRGRIEPQIARCCYLCDCAVEAAESHRGHSPEYDLACEGAYLAARAAATARQNNCYQSSVHAGYLAAQAFRMLAEAAELSGDERGRAYAMAFAAKALSDATEI